MCFSVCDCHLLCRTIVLNIVKVCNISSQDKPKAFGTNVKNKYCLNKKKKSVPKKSSLVTFYKLWSQTKSVDTRFNLNHFFQNITSHTHHIISARSQNNFHPPPSPRSNVGSAIRKPTKEFWLELSVQPTLNGEEGECVNNNVWDLLKFLSLFFHI